MTGKKLFEKLENVDADLVDETAKQLYGEEKGKEIPQNLPHNEKGTKRQGWYLRRASIAAVVLVFVLCGLFVWRRIGKDSHSQMVQEDIRGAKQEQGAVDSREGGSENPETEADAGGSGKLETEADTGGSEETGRKKENAAQDIAEADMKKTEAGCREVQSVSYPKQNMDKGWEDIGQTVKGSYLKNLLPFYKKSFQDIFGADTEKNVVYSPVNYYLCLAMLTEMTGGNTQKQLMDVLGQGSLKEIRSQSKLIWEGTYVDNRISKCILGDSVWLRQDIPFEKSVLKTLSQNYYTSTYQGEMGTEETDQKMQEWVNRMTGNMLESQAGKIETKQDTAFTLFSTAYYHDQWSTPFEKKLTKKRTFTNADGTEESCDFMKQTVFSSVYQKERFLSAEAGFENGNIMHLFLPTEESNIQEILEQDIEEILHISSRNADRRAEYCDVTLLMPKFEAESTLDLIPLMQKMGVTDLFQPDAADFSKLVKLEHDTLWVDKAEQSTKAAVDENGCSVASFTEVGAKDGAGLPEKKITVNLNRPFLFVISNYDGVPVFAGVINNM